MSHPRPTSPHLQIYRWLFTNTLSIFHRMTGFALAIGTVLLVAWLVIAAYYPVFYYDFQQFMGSYIGMALLAGWTAAFYYHLANGIRHLFWDIGKGFDLKEAKQTGMLVIIFATGMTLYTWWAVYSSTCQAL